MSVCFLTMFVCCICFLPCVDKTYGFYNVVLNVFFLDNFYWETESQIDRERERSCKVAYWHTQITIAARHPILALPRSKTFCRPLVRRKEEIEWDIQRGERSGAYASRSPVTGTRVARSRVLICMLFLEWPRFLKSTVLQICYRIVISFAQFLIKCCPNASESCRNGVSWALRAEYEVLYIC